LYTKLIYFAGVYKKENNKKYEDPGPGIEHFGEMQF
jgi:hypothetical protein